MKDYNTVYSSPRSFIQAAGRVYAEERNFQQKATAYCGNIPSSDELDNLPLADLQKLLTNRNGNQNANVKVAPGKEVPFIIVFGGIS